MSSRNASGVAFLCAVAMGCAALARYGAPPVHISIIPNPPGASVYLVPWSEWNRWKRSGKDLAEDRQDLMEFRLGYAQESLEAVVAPYTYMLILYRDNCHEARRIMPRSPENVYQVDFPQ